MKFADLLRLYRKRSQLSKTDLANRLEISPSYLMLIEAGKRKPPSLSMVRRLVLVLDLAPREEAVFVKTAAIERIRQPERSVIQGGVITSPSFGVSPEIAEALQDPIAKKALLITHKSDIEIKSAIEYMLTCLPDLEPEKRKALMALCK